MWPYADGTFIVVIFMAFWAVVLLLCVYKTFAWRCRGSRRSEGPHNGAIRQIRRMMSDIWLYLRTPFHPVLKFLEVSSSARTAVHNVGPCGHYRQACFDIPT